MDEQGKERKDKRIKGYTDTWTNKKRKEKREKEKQCVKDKIFSRHTHGIFIAND